MKRFILPALVAGLFAVSAQAADDFEVLKITNAEFIKMFDKDGDGFLSMEELPEKYAAAFPKLDGDKNKKLDEREVGRLLTYLKQVENKALGAVGNALRAFDKNKDGMLSADEAQANQLFKQNFKNWDADGNGQLDKAELLAAAKGEAPTQQVAANDPGPGPGPRPGPGGRPTPQPQPRPAVKPPLPKDLPFFDSLDKDFDGVITQGELQGSPLFFYFAEFDTDKNGKIEPKEYEAFIKKNSGGN
ncbi:MAG: hypothetical protein AB7K24_06940 [Gemmataceae bacterium]